MTNTVTETTKQFPTKVLIKTLSTSYNRFREFCNVLRTIKELNAATQIPLCYPSDDGKEMIVFPNVVFHSATIMKMMKSSELTALRIPTMLVAPTFNTWTSDIQNTHKAKRWERPESTFNKKESTTFPRFIRNYLGLELSAEKLRDIGTMLEVKFKPPHILFCKTPEDHIMAFNTRAMGSCCRPGSTYFTPIYQDMLEIGRSPGEWYGYNPLTQVVCLIKNGRSMARAVLTRTDPKQEFKSFCTLYAETGPWGEELRKELTRLGYNGSGYGHIRLTVPFEIPAIEYKGKYYCPMISHDAVAYDYYLKFDNDKKVWNFAPSSTVPKGKDWVRIGGTHTSYTYHFFPESTTYTKQNISAQQLIVDWERVNKQKWTVKAEYKI